MSSKAAIAHPYMPNSVPETIAAMLADIGAGSVEELFEQIPDDHRLKGRLELPVAIRSESELKRHLLSLLKQNQSCEANLSFLGAGCWQHHVPAVVDEIAGRSEFLTSVWGTPSSDKGRNQAWFEFASQLGELVGMEFVGLPVYSWGYAAGFAIRMASRITGRREVLLPRSLDPERLGVIRNLCQPEGMAGHIRIVTVDCDWSTGRLSLADLKAKLSDRTAAVYFDNPSFLGVIEAEGAEIAAVARAAGAETIVGVDPSSLGILAPPSAYGADIVVGTTQPLGIHMHCGGGSGGFIASRDEERYARQYPTLNITIAETVEPGEHGFALCLAHQSSYGMREEGRDWTGNSVYLWTIANAVYMALMGPDGFRELGEVIIQRSHYAAQRLADVPGVSLRFGQGFFKELVVSFDGVTVAEVDRGLRERGIFGGKDLSADFPELGQSALYAFTEVHGKDDIERLCAALREVIGR